MTNPTREDLPDGPWREDDDTPEEYSKLDGPRKEVYEFITESIPADLYESELASPIYHRRVQYFYFKQSQAEELIRMDDYRFIKLKEVVDELKNLTEESRRWMARHPGDDFLEDMISPYIGWFGNIEFLCTCGVKVTRNNELVKDH